MAKRNADQTQSPAGDQTQSSAGDQTQSPAGDQTQSSAAGVETPNPSPPPAPAPAPTPGAAPQVLAPQGLRSDDWAAHVTASPGERPQAQFKIFTPNPGFEGQRVSVSFRDGVGWTDNGLRRTALAELGYAWLDTETGERWWPGKPAEQDPRDDDGVNNPR